MTLEEMIESLYDLDRAELRRLAWEALLISDGPDKIDGEVEGPVEVILELRSFKVSNRQN